jgi:hypothetical protein
LNVSEIPESLHEMRVPGRTVVVNIISVYWRHKPSRALNFEPIGKKLDRNLGAAEAIGAMHQPIHEGFEPRPTGVF